MKEGWREGGREGRREGTVELALDGLPLHVHGPLPRHEVMPHASTRQPSEVLQVSRRAQGVGAAVPGVWRAACGEAQIGIPHGIQDPK